MTRTRFVVGCMTGTSLDGIDAALVHVTGRGLKLRATVLAHRSASLGPLLCTWRDLAEQRPVTAHRITAAIRDAALRHLRLIRRLVGNRRLDLVALHGQTVFHRPPHSWQAVDPMPVAVGLNVPVVCDLRGADLACGGQGAPITPLADWVFFAHPRKRRLIVNLGGFINITLLPPRGRGVGAIRGGDVCACNQVLDAVARARLKRRYDAGGEAALRGGIHPRAYEALLRVLRKQSRGGRSLGTGDEAMQWAEQWPRVPAMNLARSACAAIAQTLHERAPRADELILAGGSVHNAALLTELRQRFPVVRLSDELGVPTAAREAAAMAVLGALACDGVPITLPRVTGAKRSPRSGSWVFPRAGSPIRC